MTIRKSNHLKQVEASETSDAMDIIYRTVFNNPNGQLVLEHLFQEVITQFKKREPNANIAVGIQYQLELLKQIDKKL